VAIKIPFLAEMRDFMRGLRDGSEGVDDLAGDLDDLARDGARDASKLGESLTDVGDDGERAADRLEASFKDALDSVRADGKRAGDDVGDSVKRGTDRAGDGLNDFKSEADQTAKETAASFDGSAESIGDAFQEVAANALGGFGPAGAAAGLAAAVGIGIVTSRMEQAKEEAQETAQEIADVAGELIELGTSTLGAEQVDDALRDMASTAEDGKNKLDEIGKTARDAGIDFKDYARGLAGDQAAISRSYAEVTRAASDNRAEVQRVADEQGYYSKAAIEVRKELVGQFVALMQAKDALLEQDSSLDQATSTAELYRRAVDETTTAVEAQTDSTTAAAEAQEALATTLESFVDPLGVYSGLLSDKTAAEQASAQETANATSSQKDSWQDYAGSVTVSVDEYLAELDRQVAAQETWAANMATLAERGVSQGVIAELAKLGPEAAPLVASFAAGTDAQLAQLEGLFARRAATSVENLATGIEAGAPRVDTAVGKMGEFISPLRIRVDEQRLQNDVDTAARRVVPPTVEIPVRGGRAVY
jgi:hypothetical protein